MSRHRQPAGSPVGGQFATSARTEARLDLTSAGPGIAAAPGPAHQAALAHELAEMGKSTASCDPFRAGYVHGARIAAATLNDPTDDGSNLRQIAHQALRKSVEQETEAVISRGPQRYRDAQAYAADMQAGTAEALLYAAHRLQQPGEGREWAADRARSDARQVRRQLGAPQPVSFWASLKQSFGLAGAAPSTWRR